MTWCARCDETTTGPAGAACPSCGSPTLDAKQPSGRRLHSATQVLELEEAPPLLDAEIIAETPDVEHTASPRRRLHAIRGRSRFVAAILVLAVAGGIYTAAKPDPNATPSARPTSESTPTVSTTVVAPPLGEPASGSLLLGFQGGFTLIDLRTGNATELELGMEIMGFVPAPRGSRIAYLDPAAVLMVTTPYTDERTPIATEVRLFAWTPDGESLIVARTQQDTRGRERTRIEMISLSDRTPVLLAETYAYPATIASNGGTNLVTLYEDDTSPNIYEVQPGTLRLVRKNATLLDLSPDGRRALVAAQGPPRLLMVDVSTREATRVGPRRFLASAAQFSRDGRTVAVTGTPHFTMELSCEGDTAPCERYPYATDQILWALDANSLELRSVEAWSSPEVASPPVWGPDGWVFLQAGDQALAISMTDASRPNVDLIRDASSSWGFPAYLP